MSKSSSMGDLVPKDITEILALQSKVKKSKKKRGSSLGRAFSWFKGSNLKKSVSNGQRQPGNLGGLTGECTIIKDGHDNHEFKVGQKQDQQGKLTVHYTATQHYQENVFIEGHRPKYLEDLHTEAQEGLKIQQEEQNNGVDFQDDKSTSTGTTQEKDVNGQYCDGRLSPDSTAEPSATSVPTVSALASRPALKRQGSTFKPLNAVKRLEKSQKRNRRTTIMGIPQQVQRELCMGKGNLLQHLSPGEDNATVIIPTIDGEAPVTNHNGARVHLQDIDALQDFKDEQYLTKHIQAVYKDDSLQNGKSGPQTSNIQRPKSLAVPGITTSSIFLQEPQSPVMSMSPQATYLSTIIPNAILPSSIDVIKIDRTCNRRSVHMVSKNSLASASPRSSRSGGGTHDEPPSTSSKWSSSQSSETIVSNPSTTSFKGVVPHSQAADSMKESTDLKEEQISLKSAASWSSSTSKGASQRLEHKELSNGGETAQNNRLFSQNLAILKAKLPPVPPPRRTNSAQHDKLTDRSREMAETKDLKYLESSCRHITEDLVTKQETTSSYTKHMPTHSPVFSYVFHSSVTVSPHSPGQEFTGDQPESTNSSAENKFERTVSPSSGYSSQSVTPTHSSKESSTSPGRLRVKPPKPERISARIAPVASVSSSLSSKPSAMLDLGNQLSQTKTFQSKPQQVSPTVTATNKIAASTATTLRESFDIPPPPKVKAPCLPPPETWSHNKHTTDLLCGPALNTHRIYELQKQQQQDNLLMKDQVKTDNTELTSAERQISEKTKTNKPVSEDKEVMTEAGNVLVQEQVALDKSQALKHTKSSLVHETEDSSSQVKQKLNTVEDLEVQEEPEVVKDHQRESSTNEHFKTESCHLASDVFPETETLTPKAEETQRETQYVIKSVNDKDIPNYRPPQNLSVEGPKTNGVSPSPSPLPKHLTPSPSSKTSLAFQRSHKEVQPEKEKELQSLDSSWPPPPPPMAESSDLIFEGQDEIDFPPPPPPIIQEPPLNMLENRNMQSTGEEVNLAPEKSSNISSTTSQTEANAETQFTLNTTMLGNASNEPPAVDSIKVIPECKPQKPQNSQSPKEAIPPTRHHEPTNPPTITQDFLSPKTSHASALPAESAITSLEDQSAVNFRRQQNVTGKDCWSKDLLSRHKSAPIPKEDANIPLVTPSLLQMVRLRSVNVEDQISTDLQEGKAHTENSQDPVPCASNQATPQKPARKSCLKSIQSSPATVSAPSMRLQEAVRMKTAAMSSSGLLGRPSLHISTHSTNSNHVTVMAPKTPDYDLHKSPASTASFIFSKSTKKVIIETPTTPEVQLGLKQNLAAELIQISDQSKVTNGTKKPVKVPPPVAKKPVHATNLSDKTGTATTETSSKPERNSIANNMETDNVPPAGHQAQTPGNQMPAKTASTVQVS